MKPSLLIIDGNNWFRRKAETDLFGKPMRSCFFDIQNNPFDCVVLVWDGFGGLKARREIYPEYKATRNKPVEDIFIFQDEFKKLAQLSRAISIQMNGYEADDVIAALVQHYRTNGSFGRIVIESTDADFTQLDAELLRAKPLKAERDLMVTYKTCVGDPSDNIKGIGGFGQKAWDSLTPDNKKTLKFFVEKLGTEDQAPLTLIADFMPKRCMTWFEAPGNLDQVRKYCDVVRFIPIPFETIIGSMEDGLNRPDLAEGLLKEFMV